MRCYTHFGMHACDCASASLTNVTNDMRWIEETEKLKNRNEMNWNESNV